jgi:endoglucanase
MKQFSTKITALEIIVVIVAILSTLMLPFSTIQQAFAAKILYYGVVDPEMSFKDNAKVNLENRFIAWDKTAENFTKQIDEIIAQKRKPLITIEPWSLVAGQEYSFKNLKGDVYKTAIQNICRAVESRGKKVILRWGHEMEQVGSRYPWAKTDAEGFKYAYRFWVNTCRAETKLVDFMWSPAGRENMGYYYPGDKYVDSIGLSTFGHPEFELKELGKTYSFDDHFNERYRRVEKYKKPVYLAEFGVASDDNYKAQWLKQAKKSILDETRYKYLTGIVYFQAKDSEPWTKNTSAPDFRIPTNLYPFN